MINHIDRGNCRVIANKVEEALKTLGQELGLNFHCGRVVYAGDGKSMEVKLECGMVSATGVVESKEAAAFRMAAHLYGLKPEHLGQTITFGHEQFQITGLRPNAPRRPIMLKRLSDGATRVAPAEGVARAAKTQLG